MGFTLLQINIRHFSRNKYLLQLEISNCSNPDIIILINETGKIYGEIHPYIRGYNKTFAINPFAATGANLCFTSYMQEMLQVQICTLN